jgi:hypothetical protein
MPSKITYDVLEAQQYCRLKAHRRLRGDIGTKSDFEKIVLDTHQEIRAKAVTKIRRQHGEDELERAFNCQSPSCAEELRLSSMGASRTIVTRFKGRFPLVVSSTSDAIAP